MLIISLIITLIIILINSNKMGENVIIKAVTVIDQPAINRTLLQIDIWYEEQNKYTRIFIDSREFFTLLSKSTNEN